MSILADFVKKRDPRVKEYMKQQQIEQEKRVQEHKEALMLAKLAKKEMRERYVEPEWAKAPSFVNSEEEEAGSDDDDIENDQEEVEEEEEDIYARNLDQNEDDGAFSSQEEDEEDTDELYCVACNKVFKSDRQVSVYQEH